MHTAGLLLQQKCQYLFTNVGFELLPVVITSLLVVTAILPAVFVNQKHTIV
jgi:hypothetical protein